MGSTKYFGITLLAHRITPHRYYNIFLRGVEWCTEKAALPQRDDYAPLTTIRATTLAGWPETDVTNPVAERQRLGLFLRHSPMVTAQARARGPWDGNDTTLGEWPPHNMAVTSRHTPCRIRKRLCDCTTRTSTYQWIGFQSFLLPQPPWPPPPKST